MAGLSPSPLREKGELQQIIRYISPEIVVDSLYQLAKLFSSSDRQVSRESKPERVEDGE
jgi:hypothetical protein